MDSYGARFPIEPGSADGYHFLIVEAHAYPDIADALRHGAVAALEAAGATHETIAVPSALELPAAVAMALDARDFDGYIALGCVIRGHSGHYDAVVTQSVRALIDLSVGDAVPLGVGLLAVENEGQALARARPEDQDRGGDAARAALALAAIKAKLND